MKRIWQSPAVRVAVYYALAASAWIAGSDLILGALTGSPPTYTTLSSLKGFGFVAVTSVLLFGVMRRLLRTEEKFRQLAENISEVFWMVNLDLSEVSYVSPAYERIWGRSCASLYERPTDWIEGIHPEDREAVRAAFTGSRGEAEVTIEYRVIRPDGSMSWVLDRAFPLRGEAGKSIGLVGIANDITERKRADQDLRQSEQLYRTIFEAANDAIILLRDGRFIDCNERAAQMFRCPREQVLNLPPEALSPEVQPDGGSSAELARENLRRALAGEPQFFQWQHRRPDGTTFMAEVSLRSIQIRSEALVLGIVRDITARLRAEEALRENEEKLRTVYNSMNEGLALHEVVYDRSGRPVDYRILDVNPAYERITSLSRNDVLGKLASAIYAAGEAPYLEVYAQVAHSGRPAVFETFFAPMSKHFAVSVFSPRKGQFATIFSDITKRKATELEVRSLNQVYALVSHINEAIVRIADRETLFQEACRITIEHGQFCMAWIGLVGPDGVDIRPVAWAGHEHGYLGAIRTTSAAEPEGRGPTGTAVREGRVVICGDIENDPRMGPWREAALERGYRSSIALPLKLGGKTIGAFCVYAAEAEFFTAILAESLIEVAADISFALDLFERNRQREAEQQQLKLQHSALEAAANAIAITDRAGVIQWVNDAFTRLTGYSRQEAVGQTSRLLKSGFQDHRFYDTLWRTVLGGSVWQGTLRNRRKDGVLYEEEMTITPVRDALGEISHFIAIKQDITERRKLEQQFLRAQRMQSIGLLAGGVAHDLNNVLAPVLLALPLLRTASTPEQRDQLIETLERSVQRGANIVQQVLTFARGIEVQRTTIQLRHLLRDVVKISEETFPRDIRIHSSVSPDLWSLQGDATQIHQVLLNLAVNARDAMPNGGDLRFAARNVELSSPRQFAGFQIPPGRYISLSVKDTGTGIDPEIIERIFEPFFTTKPNGKGTGLGLSTVLGIVKSHGGLVELTTQMGAGSTFTVYLPATPGDTSAPPALERFTIPPAHGETILLVDDEAGLLEVIKSTLQATGYTVIAASEGAQALVRFRESQSSIKAVVTDIMMPVMDGVGLVRTIRATHPDLPIIATTGLMAPPDEESRVAALRGLGVTHFLRKPFEAEELLETLRGVLLKPQP